MVKQSDQMLQKVWSGLDVLRGAVDSSQYIDILLSLFTLKVLNDNEDHPYILPSTAQWREIQVGPSIRKNLHQAFHDLEKENHDLQDAFTFDHTFIHDEEVLRKFIRHLDKMNFSRNQLEDPDPLNGTLAQTVEGLLDRLAADQGRSGGEFFTPIHIGTLLAALLSPKEGSVYDGAAGSGGFLIEAAKQAQPQPVKLYGQEVNRRTYGICKQNFILHGLYDAKVKKGDTIREPQWADGFQLKRFDYVLMNPPFSLRNWGQREAGQDPYGRFQYGIPSGIGSDLAFVQHALSSLKDQGKAAIVIPMGVLFRGGADQQIRQALLEEDVIDAVISLPPNLFYNTGIPVAILILNKNKSHKGKVQFIYAQQDFQQGRRQNQLLEKIVQTYRDKQEVQRYSRLVSLEEIKEKDWVLTVARYIEASSVETSIGNVMVSTKAYENSDLPLKVLGELSEPKPFRGMNPPKENEEEPNSHLINLVDVQDGKILFNQLKPTYVEPRRALRFEAKPGDVLVSSRGTALKVAVIPETQKKLLPSNNFIVVRPKEGLHSHFLKVFLESPVGVQYIETLQGGSVAPIINPKHLASIKIPLLPYHKQERIARHLLRADNEKREAIQAAEKKYQQQLQELYDEMGILKFIERS
ncbi:type I restriction enzyme M protein [Melghirimyces profundicolus]|uniref:site-specific DNA-methyltransferase (adenine-specific) n=1 Tax=Melghirimyces profundicolus TaxID=1242148 RepID=A0A2T6BU10_9BACL|nr:N-6 DNA methylase [Melghirimyces profundicolus]PTX59578.1 type I restriction enzyme M protein [Melghirimyces profundicolus]